jgi:hypothetical protein
MDEASIINFDDDISAFNGIVAVTTRDDLLPFHRVRAREDAEEGPPSARRAQARWIILSPCFATLSSRLICFEHTGQISFSYAMEPRYRLMATGRRRRRVYVLLPSSEDTTARHSGAWWGDCVSRARLSTVSHRVNAVAEGDRWNAEVRSRRTLSQEKPHVEIVSNYKLTRDLAELSALTWARRWIDLQLNDGPEPAHP